MIKVLVVCTGNTCRSPIAQELLDDAVDRSSSLGGKVKVSSAGTFTAEDAEATREAQEVAEEYGLSLERHKAQQFTAEMAEKADIILAMDAIVYEQMEAIAPEETKKMHMFLGFANGVDGEQRGEEFSVLDPFDKDMDEYRACAAQLKCAAEKIAERLEKEITE